MIPEIKKILYATDLSKMSYHAFSYAASIANRHQAKITILHVLEELSEGHRGMVTSILGEEKWEELKKKNEQQVFETIKKRLNDFCEDAKRELASCPFTVEKTEVKIGYPAEEILRQAETGGYDLVVIGSHGESSMSALADALMGNTARKVLQKCAKPVLIVRLPEEKS
jgi:nucleotide-binding universal stress UspA family protein